MLNKFCIKRKYLTTMNDFKGENSNIILCLQYALKLIYTKLSQYKTTQCAFKNCMKQVTHMRFFCCFFFKYIQQILSKDFKVEQIVTRYPIISQGFSFEKLEQWVNSLKQQDLLIQIAKIEINTNQTIKKSPRSILRSGSQSSRRDLTSQGSKRKSVSFSD